MSTESQIIKLLEKTYDLFFHQKRKFENKITLEDSEENINSDHAWLTDELNNFFQNATKTLNINENSYIVDASSSMTDPVDQAVRKYKNHSIILFIKQKLENVGHLSFRKVSISKIEKELRDLNSNKVAIIDNIPSQILKQSRKSCSDTLQKLFNNALRHAKFLDKLKFADINENELETTKGSTRNLKIF